MEGSTLTTFGEPFSDTAPYPKIYIYFRSKLNSSQKLTSLINCII